MANERGVHLESLLCTVSALAGYACQAQLRAPTFAQGKPEAAAMTVVGTKDGKNFYFGDALNEALVVSTYSVWRLAAAAAQHNDATNLPDIHEIFTHVAGTVGEDRFGIPRLPDNQRPADDPINDVTNLWPVLFSVLSSFAAARSNGRFYLR